LEGGNTREVLEGDIDVTVGMNVLDVDVLGMESIVGRVVILLDHHVLEVLLAAGFSLI